MTLYALDDIDDAIDATRALLWPFGLRRWAKLALVVFFLGGAGSGFPPVQFGSGAPTGGPGGVPADLDMLPDLGPNVLAIVAAVVGVGVGIALLFLLLSSIMEFVFVESLARETVTIRRYWSERWRQGLRLFGFRLVLGLVSLVLVGGPILLALLPWLSGEGPVSVGLLLLAIPVSIVAGVVFGLVNGFTTVFVVPIMIAEERGVLAGWRRFWPTLTGQWTQYLAYAAMGFVLLIAAGFVAGVATLVLGFVLAIPFGIVALLGVGLYFLFEVAGIVVVGVVAALFLLSLFVVYLLVSVPIQAFLRYYALFVLGDTNESFDLIPERRRTVRE